MSLNLSKCLLSCSMVRLRGPRSSTYATKIAAEVCRSIEGEIRNIQEAGTFKVERIIKGRQGVLITVGKDRGKPLLNFCANNYLGLSSHPDVIAAGKATLDSHGAGLSSVRFICGTQDIHRKLEEQIAKFHGKDDSILYAACFDANAGIFEVLLGKDDAVFTDQLNHASIIDGIRLCKAQRHVYKHLDLADLEQRLQSTQDCRRRLIVTDGVFSMDGDVSPLKEIKKLADKYKALLMIDECHATGFLGETGRGTEELTGVKVDIINSTLGKALGGAMGGYTTAPQPIVDLLRQRSRPYLFSNSLAPAVVGSSLKVMEMLMADSSLAQSLKSKVHLFRSKMTAAGFTVVGNPDHPICPVMLGDARLASNMADEMLNNDIYVIGFSYPVVPMGGARIRVQISAAHSERDIQTCVDAFVKVGKKLKVIQ